MMFDRDGILLVTGQSALVLAPRDEDACYFGVNRRAMINRCYVIERFVTHNGVDMVGLSGRQWLVPPGCLRVQSMQVVTPFTLKKLIDQYAQEAT